MLAPNPRSRIQESTSLWLIGALGVASVLLSNSISGPGGALGLHTAQLHTPSAIVAVAIATKFCAGELDLSSAGLFTLSLAMLALPNTVSDPYVILMLVVTVMIAAVIGVTIWQLGNPELVGFSLLFALNGLAFAATGEAAPVVNTDPSHILGLLNSSVFGVPRELGVLVIAMLGSSYLLRGTAFGRSVHAVGVDPKRAQQIGVSPARIRIGTHVVAGALIAIAATTSLARTGLGGATAGTSTVILSLAAVVVGNGGIFPARFAPERVVVAALLLGGISDQLQTLGLRILMIEFMLAVLVLVGIGITRVREANVDT